MATRTWTGGGANDSWGTTANWDTGVPVTGDDVIFAGTTRLTPSNSNADGLSLNSITFAAAAGAFTISGATLGTITNGITNNSSNTQTLSLNINSAMTITTPSGGNIVLSGAVAGALTKAGIGTLTLSGTGDNAGTGATVSAGTLILAKDSNANVHAIGGSNLVVNSGATVQLAGTGGDQIYFGGNININGTLDMNGRSEDVTNFDGSGTVDNTAATAVTLTMLGAGTFSGVIKNTSGAFSLVKNNAGTLTLSGQNSYTGTTTINGGTVITAGGRPLGFSAVTVASGATLSASGHGGFAGLYFQRPGAPVTGDHNTMETLYSHLSGLTIAQGDKPITLNMGETGSGFPSPYNSSMNNLESVYSARFSVSTTGLYTFDTRSDDGSMLWIDGAIVVNNNFYQAMTTRSGTITLTAGVVYTITVSFYQGGGGYGLFARISGAGNTTMVDINTTNVTSLTADLYIESLAGAGSVVLSGGNLTTTGAASTTFSGVISGVGNFRKMGSGTLSLTGVNTFTGTLFVTGGTLSVGDGTTDGSVATAANIVNNATLTWNLVNARTYMGIISGTGALVKLGAGTLTLTRTNTYTGATTVTLGTLKLRNSWRYLRFTPTAWVGADVQQIAELQFFLDGVWTAATTVTNPGGSNPVGEEPTMANDNNTATKWLDNNRLALVYDYATQVLFDEYNWATANDAPARDPLRWRVEGSHDNAAWTVLDDRTGADQAVSSIRQAWVAPIFDRFWGWPLGNGTNVLPTGTALTVSANATLDVGGLVQTVASATFAAGSTLRIDLNTGPATKNGRLTVTSTATVAGTVEVGLNTLSVLTTAHTVLSAATLSGTFQAVSTDLTLGGRTFAITYPTNTVVLTDAGDPRTFFSMFF